MYDVWQNALAEIERSVSAGAFSTFFKLVDLKKVEGDTATLTAPNIFIQKQMMTKYNRQIIRALNRLDVPVTKIDCVVAASKVVKAKRSAREVLDLKTETKSQESFRMVREESAAGSGNFTNLNPRYTMANFVVGSSNDLAASVAKAIIENPGAKYNPFFLYGGPGLGKTHLVQAIGNEIVRKNPKTKVLYTPIDHFYSEFIREIQASRGDQFSAKYRRLDVLIIDDIQMIVGKEKSQVEFFHLFNDLYQQNKQIIITSDRMPNQIKTIDERLASRLACAGAFDIQMPSFEDKCAILRAKADFEGKEIEQEAIEYIAENVKTNIRELESEYSKVMALSDLKGISPLQLINDGYASIAPSGSARIVSPRQVVEKTAKYYQIEVKELKSKSRVANIKTARQVAMYILSKELSMSTPKIAAEVGVKDHTTVMHGVKKIEADLKLNFSLREQLNEIKRSIYG